MNPQLSLSTLYEQDYYLWLEQTAHLLRERRFQNVDVENLVEEIEDMGRSQKDALYSNLKVVLMHLLKWKYQQDLRSNSWRASIREHRQRLKKAFKDSPSLKRYFTEIFDECYSDARPLAADETNLPLDTFPELCPFSTDKVLNPDYLPDLEEDVQPSQQSQQDE
jgi:predicted DNA-binding ribbon-helix-helix protein